MSSDPNVELLEVVRRPDPFFKLLTEDVAVQVGLKRDSTQLPYPQITTTDLVFNASPELKLEDTLFDFFRAINNVEFKSENDPFTLREFVLNSIQTYLLFWLRREPNFKKFLSVIVSSRLPEAFLAEAQADGLDFTPDPKRPWLRFQKVGFQKVGFQNVVIVVCRDLPIKERYYPWLLFAPTGSVKWQTFIRHLHQNPYQQKNLYWLDRAKEFRPMEVNMITKEMVQKIRAEQPLEEQLEYQRQVAESEEMLKETLRTLPPRLLLAGLAPKERLEGLAPAEIAAVLSPQERLEGLAPQERLEGLAPQERLEGLSPEQRQALLQLLQEQVKKPQE